MNNQKYFNYFHYEKTSKQDFGLEDLSKFTKKRTQQELLLIVILSLILSFILFDLLEVPSKMKSLLESNFFTFSIVGALLISTAPLIFLRIIKERYVFLFSSEVIDKEKFLFFHSYSKVLFNSISKVANSILSKIFFIFFKKDNDKFVAREICAFFMGLFFLSIFNFLENKVEVLIDIYLFFVAFVASSFLVAMIFEVLNQISKKKKGRNSIKTVCDFVKAKLEIINKEAKIDISIIGRSLLVYSALVSLNFLIKIAQKVRRLWLLRGLFDKLEAIILKLLLAIEWLMNSMSTILVFLIQASSSLLSLYFAKESVLLTIDLKYQSCFLAMSISAMLIYLGCVVRIINYKKHWVKQFQLQESSKRKIGLVSKYTPPYFFKIKLSKFKGKYTAFCSP